VPAKRETQSETQQTADNAAQREPLFAALDPAKPPTVCTAFPTAKHGTKFSTDEPAEYKTKSTTEQTANRAA